MIKILKKLDLILLILLIICIPIHYKINTIFPFYRELTSIIFLFFVFIQLFKDKSEKFRKEIFYLLLFPLILIFFIFFDTGEPLYEGNDITNISDNVSGINPVFYAFRNILVYLPMVFYFNLRGLTHKEINYLAALNVIIAPISVIYFLYFHDVATIENLAVTLGLGGDNLQYNSYVPYLTFPTLSCLYLISINKSKGLNIILYSILIFLSLYIFVTTSRQSFYFLIFQIFLFLICIKKKYSIKNLILPFIFIVTIFFIWDNISTNNKVNDKLTDRYSSVNDSISDKTSRLDIIIDGISRLEGYEFIIGAGITSVLNSGPHNDYIRLIQRVGIPMMILSFLPFFIAIRGIYKLIKLNNTDPVNIYLFIAILFTIYHSTFGYPREDSYQAFHSFLGLLFWLGYIRNLPIIKNENIHN